MKKKEFKIGDTFQFGLIKLRVEEREEYCCNCCKGCYFLDNDDLQCGEEIEKLAGYCSSSVRSDGKNVAFVKVEE